MIRNKPALPLTATALAVLLAACGGAGSGDSAGGGTSNGSAPKDVISAQAANAPAQAKDGSTEKQVAGAHIDATGVSGELLAAMLDHRTCHHTFLDGATTYNGPAAPDRNQPQVLARSGLEPTPNYELIPGLQAPSGPAQSTVYYDHYCQRNFFRHTPVNDGSHDLLVREVVPSGELGMPDNRDKPPFHALTFTTPLTFSQGSSVSLGAQQELYSGNDIRVTLSSASVHTFQTNARIPFGEVAVWRQDSNFNELMVLRGDNDRQAKLCWNTQTPNVRRLYCQVWSTPDGWQRNNGTLNLEDQYIVDDRAMHAGESGHFYWRSNVRNGASAQAAAAPAATNATVPGQAPTDDALTTPGSVTTPAATPASAN